MIRWTGLLAVLLVVAACGDGQADTTAQTAAVGDPERGRQILDDGADTVLSGGCSKFSNCGHGSTACSLRGLRRQRVRAREGSLTRSRSG